MWLHDKLEERNTLGRVPQLSYTGLRELRLLVSPLWPFHIVVGLFWPISISCLFVAGMWIRSVLLTMSWRVEWVPLIELVGMGKWFVKLRDSENCWCQWEFRVNHSCVFLCPFLNCELPYGRAPTPKLLVKHWIGLGVILRIVLSS